MSETMDTALRRAADAIDRAEAMLIGAGAGMGVDSGLPDFRGRDGSWRAYPPYQCLGGRAGRQPAGQGRAVLAGPENANGLPTPPIVGRDEGPRGIGRLADSGAYGR
jgi:hypothetical protein